VDQRIRRTFSIPFRSSDLIARWYSGDEVVILFDGEIEGARHKMRELAAAARAQDLSFCSEHDFWRVGEEPVKDIVDRMGARICRAKGSCVREGNRPRPAERLATAAYQAR
jgi:hypothetical protein